MGSKNFLFMFHPGGGWLFKLRPATPSVSSLLLLVVCNVTPCTRAFYPDFI